MFESRSHANAVSSLVFARVVYAVNWLNIGAIFFLMGPGLGGGVGGLAVITSSFYLGLGLMQVPGGMIAAKFGPKKAVVTGVMVSSTATLAVALSTDVAQVTALRFLVGSGMALVFAPGVVMVARLLKDRSSGVAAGVFNSAFNFGGLFGLFAWVVVAESIGWRPSLALSGALGIVSGLAVMVLTPSTAGSGKSDVVSPALHTLLDRNLVLLGLGTLGLSVGNVVVSSFMEFYLEQRMGTSPDVAGLAAAAVVATPIFSAIWAGRRYGRSSSPKVVLTASLVAGSIALAVAAVSSLEVAAACSAAVGVVSGIGYTFAFAGARDMNRLGDDYDGLAVAWVNAISLTGSFFPPVVFSFLQGAYGYPYAWLGTTAMSLAFVAPVLAMNDARWR